MTAERRDPAALLLERLARQAVRAAVRLRTDEWADRHRVLVEEAAAEPGRWRTDRAPYTREVMRCADDPAVRQVTLMWASQLGKTECLANILMAAACQDPAPALWLFPVEDLARDFLRDRLAPAMRRTPEFAARLARVGPLRVDMERCSLWLAGSNSDARARNRPAKRRFADEIDSAKWDPEVLFDLRQRADAWPGGLLVVASIPSYPGVGIDAEYAASDRRRYFVPCPHCGACQVLRWRGLRWDGGGDRAAADAAARTARYVCAACRRRAERRHGADWERHCPAIHDHHRPAMLAGGCWLTEAQADGRETIEREEALRLAAAKPATAHAGFAISQLYSPWKEWGRLAYEWCAQDGRPARRWINGVLGETWSPRGEATRPSELRRLAIPEGHPGAYAMGQVPHGVLALVGAVDVQRDRAYAVVRGLGEQGARRWLIWAGEVPCRQGGGLAELDRLLRRRFECLGPDGRPDGRSAAPVAWAIDSGHRTVEVYEYCRRRHLEDPARRPVFACKGQGGQASWSLFRLVPIREYPGGRPAPSGGWLFEPVADAWKTEVHERTCGALQAVLECEDHPARLAEAHASLAWVYPHDVPDEYLRHVTAEQRVDASLGPDGRRRAGRGGGSAAAGRLTWTRRPGADGERNDYWDCEYMAAALAAWAQSVWGPVREPEHPAQAPGGAGRQETAPSPAALPAPAAGGAEPAPRPPPRLERRAGGWLRGIRAGRRP